MPAMHTAAWVFHAVRILRLKLEHFKSKLWAKGPSHDVTMARLEALRSLLEQELRPYMQLVQRFAAIHPEAFCFDPP